MKLTVFTISTVLVLLACSSNKIEVDSSKETLITIFEGTWVSTEYIKSIQETKSPLKSSGKLLGVAAMIIDKSFKSDSVDVGVSWNNHEGTNFTLHLINGQHQNSYKTNLTDYDNRANFYELGYNIAAKDTILVLYHYDSTNHLLDRKEFTKVGDNNPDNDASWGIQTLVNSTLIAGNYTLSSNTIRFSNDGSVTGFSDFKKYVIQTDFLGGPENLDQLCFDISTNKAKCFTYQLSGNLLKIYDIIEDTTLVLRVGKLKYTLVRN